MATAYLAMSKFLNGTKEKINMKTSLKGPILVLLLITLVAGPAHAQRFPNTGFKVEVKPISEIQVHFDRPLRSWDGFGVNYVETCQTRDYGLFPQDYSGFGFATEATREKILDLVFGEDGLRPGLTKLFLDPFHEGMTKMGNDNDDPMDIDLKGYDHETTTHWMRYFNKEGLKRMKRWGGNLTAIATLYGPAPWMTRQNYVLGRDLNTEEKFEMAEYVASWAKFLREKEDINVRYVSLHNEGDAYYRWPLDGSNPGEDHRDYNMFWPPSQVAELISITRDVLDANGLDEVGVTPGETQTWFRFDTWGYASEIINNVKALQDLGLITSHSFAFLDNPQSVYYGDYRSVGQDLIQAKRPELKSWVTSRPWADGVSFIENIRRDIYESKVNGLIPWATISGANQWMGSDGTYSDGSMKVAFLIREDGSLKINDQYYFYKQVSRAGQPGTVVAQVINLDPALGAIAFGSGKTQNPDTFVLINKSKEAKEIKLRIAGSPSTVFKIVRTSEGEHYQTIGEVSLSEDTITYPCPPMSVSTFFGINE